jgi:hypothetical protein
MRAHLLGLLVVFVVASCTHRVASPPASQKPATYLPPLAATVRGEHNFGDHVIIYGDYEERFLWGIVFPRDTMTSISSGEVPEPHCTCKLKSGITLEFRKNEVTLTKAPRQAVLKLEPSTICLMNDDLSTRLSKDLSGIRLDPKRVWSRWVNHDITVYDLVLPQDLPKRFGKNDF